MKVRDKILCGIITTLALGCVKPYSPAIVAGNNNYLVVEGNINTGTDSTTIKLSRTTNIASGITSLPELNAVVIIQDNQNGSYNLTSKGNGIYTSALLTLDPTRNYRLSITTSDNNTYVSDYVPARISPPIDSVGFTIESNGVQLYINTHDPNNATRYYHWNYNETWEFHAKYFSTFISTDSSIVVRTPAQDIYKCWTNDIASSIALGSSANLSRDVIYQAPLIFIESTSEKIEIRYSILVTQYAMTTAGYNYYNLLKQNTEELGSIFDAQPSTLTGNIHCTTSPTIPVIGYVTAGSYTQKRIYIDNSQLPLHWVTQYPYDCQADTVKYDNIGELLPLPNPNVILSYAFNNLGFNVGYLVSDPECADCTVRGTTVKPSFWIAGPEGQ